ncbi:unnamed protein product [Allacma fusca]|uniref:UDENN domain-containing protein n=1 Tax=Allacma fusca TaxID=39272 RepID=A0A8J2KHD7_9HEXA|nr:unnamed protein product [Allacma fusca]
MGSRIRERKSVKKLFECYMEVEPPWGHTSPGSKRNSLVRSPSDPNEWTPIVRAVFPPTFKDQDILKSAAQFAFPCPTNSENVDLFTFVLTSGDSKWTFGYCRHPPHAKKCTLFLSFLPWQEVFYRCLNHCTEAEPAALEHFLVSMYNSAVPEAGTCLYIPTMTKPFIYPCPPELGLPSIPENRNVSEFYNALGTDSMLTLFAAILSERRIVVTSKKLSRLSSVVIACNLFLFPMYWQHIYIPVLPTQLQDYLSAPMPFLIGVPLLVWDRIPSETLGQVVRVDSDSNTVTTPFPEDLSSVPEDVLYHLRKNLAADKVQGDGLARAFLRALAQLMGHYRDAFRDDGNSFDEDLFLNFAHHSHRPYLETKLLRLQIFQQFIDERLESIRNGSSVTDEFELESLAWRSSRANGRNGIPALRNLAGSQNKAIKKAGKAVIMSMRRESGNVIETLKQNSTLKSAIRSVKESGKNVKQKSHVAYSDIKSKFHVPSQMSTLSPHRTSAASEYGHTQLTKTYRRHSGSTSNAQKSIHNGSSRSLQVPIGSDSRLRNSDDNLVHLSSSSSASRLPDTPALGQDGIKTDEQLLSEYGLQDYFAHMNISGDSFSSSNSSGTSHSNTQTPISTPSSTFRSANPRPTSSGWTTFE